MPKIKFILISLIIFITIFSIKNAFLNKKNAFLNNTFSYISKPLGTFFSETGWWFQKKINFLHSIGNLKNENQKFFNENLILKARIARLSEIQKENDILRKELSLAPRKKYKIESALVIGRESGSYSEIIYINKGSANGLKKGMAILVGKGVLIGKIIETTTNTSKIQLITDKNFKVNAKLIESDGRGVIFGQYGTSAIMKMLPQTIKINKGDTIVTSELSNNFRKDLLIGYVQEIFNTADGLFQEVTILFPKDLEKLHLVWVLLE